MRRCGLFVILLLALSSKAFSNDSTGVGCIMGVTEKTMLSRPVPFIFLCLDDSSECVVTDSRGQFCFDNVSPGYHLVILRTAGFVLYRIDSVWVGPDSCSWKVVEMYEMDEIIHGSCTLLIYWPPLIEFDETQSARRFISEQLRALPALDIYDILRQRGGVVVR